MDLLQLLEEMRMVCEETANCPDCPFGDCDPRCRPKWKDREIVKICEERIKKRGDNIRNSVQVPEPQRLRQS